MNDADNVSAFMAGLLFAVFGLMLILTFAAVIILLFKALDGSKEGNEFTANDAASIHLFESFYLTAITSKLKSLTHPGEAARTFPT